MKTSNHKLGWRLMLLFFALSSPFLASATKKVADMQLTTPSGFVENNGQVYDQNGEPRNDVKFIYYNQGLKLVLKQNSFSYELINAEKDVAQVSEQNINAELGKVDISRVDISFLGANTDVIIKSEGKSADFTGYANAGTRNIIRAYSYKTVTYTNIYPNIDYEFTISEKGELKYNVIIRPGGRITDIKMMHNGQRMLNPLENVLNIGTENGNITETIPYSYIKESKAPVKVTFASNDGFVGFKADYPKNQTLVIDPIVTRTWGQYYPGSNYSGYNKLLAKDGSHNTYIAGTFNGAENFATLGAYQTSNAGGYDVFVAKFNSSGVRVWGTYYGGPGRDEVFGITTDGNGDLYVVGNTQSNSGIATVGAHKTSRSYTNVSQYYVGFLAKFSGSGTLSWATYYGGKSLNVSNSGIKGTKVYAVSTDDSNNVYIGGTTSDTSGISTLNSYTFTPGNTGGFVAKFTSSGTRTWGAYNNQAVTILEFNGSDIYTSNGARLNQFNRAGTKSSMNKQLPFTANKMTSDNSGNLYLAGYKFTTVNNTWYLGDYDGAAAKMDASGNVIWSDNIVGRWSDMANGISIDDNGNAYVVGYSESNNGIRTTGSYQTSKDLGTDAFVIKYNSNGTRLWGTYYGGFGADDRGNDIVCDDTSFVILGLTNSANKMASSGFNDGNPKQYFLAKFSDNATTASATNFYVDFDAKLFPDTSVAFTNISNPMSGKFVSYYWNFGDGNTSTGKSPSHKYAAPGVYYVYLKVTTQDGLTDSAIYEVNTYPQPVPSLKYDSCQFSTTAGFYQTKFYNNSYLPNNKFIRNNTMKSYWEFGDGTAKFDNNAVVTHNYPGPGSYTLKLTLTSFIGYKTIYSTTVNVLPFAEAKFQITNPLGSLDDIYANDTVKFDNSGTTIETGGTITSYMYNFGDSGNLWHVGSNPIHKYAAGGTYTVKLTVTTDHGCTMTTTRTVTIKAGTRPPYPTPVANFSLESNCNTLASFESSSTIASPDIISTQMWDFGDGNTAVGGETRHEYASPGNYSVKLKVISNHGKVDSITKSITISENVKADFTFVVSPGKKVTFTNTSTVPSGANVKYAYFFGEGHSNGVANHTFKYSALGTYYVTFVVRVMKGSSPAWDDCVSTVTKAVTIDSTNNSNVYNGSDLNENVDAKLDEASVTSVNDIQLSNVNFNIYPNPVHENLHIQCLNNGYDKNVTISIIDIVGRTMKETQFKGQINTNIDVSSLRSGTYFLRINDGQQTKVVKLVKI